MMQDREEPTAQNKTHESDAQAKTTDRQDKTVRHDRTKGQIGNNHQVRPHHSSKQKNSQEELRATTVHRTAVQENGAEPREQKSASRSDIERNIGLTGLGDIYPNLSIAQLYEHSIIMREGILSPTGALLVQETASNALRENMILADSGWQEKVRNKQIDGSQDVLQERYALLQSRVQGYFYERDVYVVDGFVGTDSNARIPVQVVTDAAWIANVVTQLVSSQPQQNKEEGKDLVQAPWVVIIAGAMVLQPAEHIIERTNTQQTPQGSTIRALHCTDRQALCVGAVGLADIKYILAGIAEYSFAQRNASLLRSLVVAGKKNDTTMLFGFGGSVRTIPFLNAEQIIVGHDAYVWNNAGVSALDTSVIEAMSPDAENISLGFGTIVQYPYDKSGKKQDGRQPIVLGNRSQILNNNEITRAHHPRTMIFLVPDVFGALPFVSRLTQEQALLFYTLGYGMKVQRDAHSHATKHSGAPSSAPTIVPNFTPCYHPSSILRVSTSVKILQERLARNNTQYWLVNTGWVYGNAHNGKRIREEHITIAIQALIAGTVNVQALKQEQIFGLQALTAMDGVPEDLLMAHATWKDMRGYESSAKRLQTTLYKAIEVFKGDIDSKVLSSVRGIIFEMREDQRDERTQQQRTHQRSNQSEGQGGQRSPHQHGKRPQNSDEQDQPRESKQGKQSSSPGSKQNSVSRQRLPDSNDLHRPEESSAQNNVAIHFEHDTTTVLQQEQVLQHSQQQKEQKLRGAAELTESTIETPTIQTPTPAKTKRVPTKKLPVKQSKIDGDSKGNESIELQKGESSEEVSKPKPKKAAAKVTTQSITKKNSKKIGAE